MPAASKYRLDVRPRWCFVFERLNSYCHFEAIAMAFAASSPETTMGDERHIFLSTMAATRGDRRAALAVVGVSAVLFACAVPFAGVPLAPVPAFVASYQSALAINDLITAIL